MNHYKNKNMVKRASTICGALLISGSIALLSSCSTIPRAVERPNIVLISVDHLDILDLQEYAHHITGEKKRKMYNETPNLDRLSAEGLSFEQARSCSHQLPAAESVLTGRIIAGRRAAEGDTAAKKAGGVTLAEVLVDYDCAFIGQWLAPGTPASAGFDQKGLPADGQSRCSEELAEQAGRYIEGRSRVRQQPFFLYVHHSLGDSAAVDARALAHFKNKRTKGWRGQSDPQHAALVKGLDNSVGHILHKLWRNGFEKKTVVIFMSVPGAAVAAERDLREQLAGCDLRVPLIIRWNQYTRAGSWCNVAVDQADILPTMMYCAGYFPESLDDAAGVAGCSLSGLFWDPKNKDASYDRDQQCKGQVGVLARPAVKSRL